MRRMVSGIVQDHLSLVPTLLRSRIPKYSRVTHIERG